MESIEHTHAPNTRKHSRTAVFNFIVAYKESHDGNSPALRDIMRAFAISSTSEAWRALDDLARMGVLRKRGANEGGCRASRSIEVVGGAWSFHAPESTR